MGPPMIGVLGFAHINIFITIYGEEELNLGVLGFACYIIFNSVFRKEDLEMGVFGFTGYIIFNSVFRKEVFDLRVLGRGPRRANRLLTLFYVILSYLMRFITILFKNSRPNRNLLQFNLKI